ncbi:MAG: hypothetical protein QOE44_2850, partial [Solirubrobacteraceae bacterium]|nr:hypothetical protein [Solirubrobacteraceae bacterium]
MIRAAWAGLSALVAVAAAAALGGCGQASRPPKPVAARGNAIVAALGDSITAGSPLWSPSAAARQRIGPLLDEQSQYEYWAQRLLGNYVRFRNCGAAG